MVECWGIVVTGMPVVSGLNLLARSLWQCPVGHEHRSKDCVIVAYCTGVSSGAQTRAG